MTRTGPGVRGPVSGSAAGYGRSVGSPEARTAREIEGRRTPLSEDDGRRKSPLTDSKTILIRKLFHARVPGLYAGSYAERWRGV